MVFGKLSAIVAGRGLTAGVICLLAICGVGSADEKADGYEAILAKKESFGLAKFPIGFWNYTSLDKELAHQQEADVRQWAEAGFTMPKGPRFDAENPEQVTHIEKMLGWCEKYGMKMVVCDPRSRGPREGALEADFAEGFREAVEDFGSYPALFGFFVSDEPGESNNEGTFEAYRIQKEIGGNLHPYLNLLPWWPGAEERVGYESWDRYLDDVYEKCNLDFYSYDCYTQMLPKGGWERYYENLKIYRDASVRNGVPFWVTLLSVGHFSYRCPDYDRLRMQFTTALCAGASGIDWFFYYMRDPHQNYRFSPVDEFWETTRTYEDLRKIHGAFHKRYGDLFNKLVSTKVMFYPKGMGGFASFEPDETITGVRFANIEAQSRPNGSILLGQFIDKEKDKYVMIVNNTEEVSFEAEVKMGCENAITYIWNWEGEKVPDGRGENGVRTVRVWLAPGQEQVFKIEKDR